MLDTVIWALQGILAAVFVFAGGMKLLAFDRYIRMVEERSGRDAGLSRPLMTVVGISEVAGGLGLVLPWATGIVPVLTPLAALGLALIMAGRPTITGGAGNRLCRRSSSFCLR